MLIAPAAASPAGVHIDHPWMRFLTPQIPVAGYFTLHNDGDHDVSLTGAASPDCGQLMLHESTVVNNVAHMAMVPSIAVPAHGSVTFRPGGYHLMCMAPTAALRPGNTAPVSLRFQDGSVANVTFPVYGATGK